MASEAYLDGQQSVARVKSAIKDIDTVSVPIDDAGVEQVSRQLVDRVHMLETLLVR